MTRRKMLATAGLTCGVAAVGRALAGVADAGISSGAVFDPRQFGALGDGKALDSPALNRAITAAARAGGGLVYVTPGVYRCGTVVLQSNITLYLEAGATLLGSTDVADYTPQPGPNPHGDANDKHLIFARDATNITLAGPGRIDGQGPTFWEKTGVDLPIDDWGAVATHRYRPRPRPSPMLEFYRVTNLRIIDVQIENAAGWTLRPMACTNVFIRGITIRNPIYGINCDGIDLTCCQDVSISDCHINTADDAICLKSEDAYGNVVGLSRNITITNCTLSCCCNGLKFGTNTAGGFENVAMSNCVISSPGAPVPERVIAGISIQMSDGGYNDGVTISNVRMQRVRCPLFVRLAHRHAPRTTGPAAEVAGGRSFLRGIHIDGLHASGTLMTSSITGQADSPVEDVSVSHTRIQTDEAARYPQPTAAAISRPVVEPPSTAYPEARMFGRLPAHGLYARHVRGLRLHGVSFEAAPPEARPAVVLERTERVEIDGLAADPISGSEPLLRLINTQDLSMRGAVAASGMRSLMRVEGAESRQIRVVGCDAAAAKTLFEADGDVPQDAIRAGGNLTNG